MFAHDHHTPQGYLLHAFMGGIAMATAYLSSTNIITAEHNHASPTLIPTPDGYYILSHLRKDTYTRLTNFVISMGNPHTYAMIATMDTPIKIKLPTTITIDGSHHQQIVYIQLIPHNRSVSSRQSIHKPLPKPPHQKHEPHNSYP